MNTGKEPTTVAARGQASISIQGQAQLDQKQNFGVQHLLAAHHFSRSVHGLEKAHAGQKFGSFFEEILWHSYATLGAAVTGLESYINECFCAPESYFPKIKDAAFREIWDLAERNQMIEAYGWAIARSPRKTSEDTEPDEILVVDERLDRADEALFDKLQEFLNGFEAPDLDWHFRSEMNNARGILTMASSLNHRGGMPAAIEVLHWLAQHGEGSYGLVYLHDDEDVGATALAHGRDGRDHTNCFRVWRLCNGSVEEFDDPFLSPMARRLHPEHG